MRIKAAHHLCVAAIAAIALFGCATAKSPYDYLENWLIREDAVRPFVTSSDVIYVQGELYLSVTNLPAIYSYTQAEVGRERFRGLARVFAPLVATQEDVEEALDWYFRHHHPDGRPFAFIGEGESGSLLKEYEERNLERLKKLGLIASYYTETTHNHFVSDEMVQEIRKSVARVRYRAVWGREMPEGMEP